MTKNKKIRGKSIARRLNAALTRRSFVKTLLIDLLAAAIVMATWCLTVENSHGGNIMNVDNRGIEVENCDVVYNTCLFTDDIQQYFIDIADRNEPNTSWTLPFYGVYYTFRVTTVDHLATAEELYSETSVDAGYTDETELEEKIKYPPEGSPAAIAVEVTEAITDQVKIYTSETLSDERINEIKAVDAKHTTYETVRADASIILTLTVGCTLLAMIFQTLSAIIKSFAGGGLIKKYLSPIDDLAIMAEQLSSETHTATGDEVRASYVPEKPINDANTVEQNETIDPSDVASLTDALDEIDDSRKRLEIHAPELSGLEAAVNNMLKRLEEGKRKQIRFVDDASHELRTPIAVIQGYANMLDRWGKDDPKVRDEAIEAIKNESEHMKTLLDQLLFLARGEMDRHVLELKPVSIDEILCEILEESQMLDKRHTYEISLASGEALEDDILENDVLILADVAMIKQSVRILCDNAVKYTPEGGTISLKSSERVSSDEKGTIRREVCIDVSDNGIGISADELPRIFDRFYRGANARSDNTGGSGLGLSIARWIIEQHHGRIEAISSPGFGTKMTIILPEYEVK